MLLSHLFDLSSFTKNFLILLTKPASEILPDFNHIFDTTRGILTVVSLIAFIAALIALCFVYYNYNERKKLKDNPEEYVAIAERLHIDFEKIPEKDRAKITLTTISARIKSQVITSVTLILLAAITGMVMVSINKDTISKEKGELRERSRKDSLEKVSQLNDQAKKDSIKNARREFTINITNPRMLAYIQAHSKFIYSPGAALRVIITYSGKFENVDSSYYYPGGPIVVRLAGSELEYSTNLILERSHPSGNTYNGVSAILQAQISHQVSVNPIVIAKTVVKCLN